MDGRPLQAPDIGKITQLLLKSYGNTSGKRLLACGQSGVDAFDNGNAFGCGAKLRVG
jgi:hypothetical protein